MHEEKEITSPNELELIKWIILLRVSCTKQIVLLPTKHEHFRDVCTLVNHDTLFRGMGVYMARNFAEYIVFRACGKTRNLLYWHAEFDISKCGFSRALPVPLI